MFPFQQTPLPAQTFISSNRVADGHGNQSTSNWDQGQDEEKDAKKFHFYFSRASSNISVSP